MARLVSVNVGLPRDVSWRGRTVHTGVWKSPVDGPRMVRRLNIDGDGQGDLGGHGGEQRAVLVYQTGSYRHWQEHFGGEELEHGAFGENFTVDGLGDDEVCVGDRFRVGEAELEVTQPRVTCYRVGMRMGRPQLPSLLVAHHRPGFYLRVLTEGRVQAGDEIVRTRHGRHALSIAEVDALLYLPGHDPDRLRDAVDVEALSPGWRGSFEAMLERPSPEPPAVGAEHTGWLGFRSLLVRDVAAESDTVTSLTLVDADGALLPLPRPGQYLTVRVGEAGDPAPVRTYSLSGPPDGESYRISVKREARGIVSSYLHAHVRAGARIEVAAPRGDFVLGTGTNAVLLVSAGIGLTPVLAMLHELVAQRSTREVWWIHTTRDASTHAFATEAADLVGSLPRGRALIYHTAAQPSSLDAGITAGRLTAAVVGRLDLPPDASAYICGPDRFMDDVGAALESAGVEASEIHTERFGSRSPVNPGVVATSAAPPHPPPGPPGTGPAVTFARSGLTVPWSDGYPSVLELAEACDVATQWSCRTGVCHTCATAVLSGSASYVLPPLEAPDPGDVLICSATPTSELVLDL